MEHKISAHRTHQWVVLTVVISTRDLAWRPHSKPVIVQHKDECVLPESWYRWTSYLSPGMKGWFLPESWYRWISYLNPGMKGWVLFESMGILPESWYERMIDSYLSPGIDGCLTWVMVWMGESYLSPGIKGWFMSDSWYKWVSYWFMV